MKRAIAGLCLAAAATLASAEYPDRPIHVVVPFAAGGGVDVLARAIGQKLGDHLK